MIFTKKPAALPPFSHFIFHFDRRAVFPADGGNAHNCQTKGNSMKQSSKKFRLLSVFLCLLTLTALCLLLASCQPDEPAPTPSDDAGATHTVRILDAEGKELSKTTGTAGTAVTYVPERTGYTFAGYFSDSALTRALTFDGLVGETDRDIYVKWSPIHYTIRFDAGRAFGEMQSLTVAYDEKVTLPGCSFVLRGESFEEWQLTAADGSVSSYIDGARVKNLTATDGATLTLCAVFDRYDAQNFTIADGVVTAYNGTATNVRFPETARVISADVFKNCAVASKITKLEIPDCYVMVEKGALAPLTSLSEVRIPFIGGSANENTFFSYLFGAESYRDNHFSFAAEIGYSSLNKVNEDYSALLIPKTLTKVVVTGALRTIPEGAFYHAYSLEKVIFRAPDELYEVGDSAFEGCISLGYDSTLSIANPLSFLETVEVIGKNAFGAYISEANSEGSTYIFTRLFSIAPLNSIVEIKEKAFYGCVYLMDLTVGEHLTTIGDSAFTNCASLKKLALPDSLRTVGAHAFTSCSSLAEITIGTGISSIGSFAFADCEGLSQVTIAATAPARIAQIPFSNGIDYSYDVAGAITNYLPVFTTLSIYVGGEALPVYRGNWVDYADILDTKQQSNIFYWGVNEDGSFSARFEIRGGNLAYVTDPKEEFLDVIDLYSDLYNTFRADLQDGTYTLSFEEVEIPANLKRGDERFYRISNPQIVDALGAQTSFLVRVRPERYTKDGATFYVPTLERVDAYFGKTGGDNSLIRITRDEWGHYIFATRATTADAFAEAMPEGAAYGEFHYYYMLAYSEKMVGMEWFDEKGRSLSTVKYFVSNDCLYPIAGNDGLEVSFTDYPNQVILDGYGQVLLSLYEGRDFNEYLGTYAFGEGQRFGDPTLTVLVSGAANGTRTYSGTLTLDGFFGGRYHRLQVSLNAGGNFFIQTFYTSYDLADTNYCEYEDGSYYYLYQFASEAGSALYADYYDVNNKATASGTYTMTDETTMELLIPGYGKIVGHVSDERGSFYVDTVFGKRYYRSYNDWENATFIMSEDFFGTTLTYYIVKMDGFGGALFYDSHDDGYDNWYKGTYTNTHKVIGSNENGDFEIYYFEGKECDKNGNLLKNGKTYRAYFVPDTITYDDEDDEGNVTYSGDLISVSVAIDSVDLTAYDEQGRKFADFTVSSLGEVSATFYTTAWKDGDFVSVKNEVLTENARAVAYRTSSGEVRYIVVYDLAGNYLFRVVKEADGDWIYEYEGPLDPKAPAAAESIYPDPAVLVPAED